VSCSRCNVTCHAWARTWLPKIRFNSDPRILGGYACVLYSGTKLQVPWVWVSKKLNHGQIIKLSVHERLMNIYNEYKWKNSVWSGNQHYQKNGHIMLHVSNPNLCWITYQYMFLTRSAADDKTVTDNLTTYQQQFWLRTAAGLFEQYKY
jgi:hypothetical protein